MLEVREVLAEGHEGFTQAHLEYVREMANRVGFSVMEEPRSQFPSVARIRLHIRMDDPEFRALLEDRAGSDSGHGT